VAELEELKELFGTDTLTYAQFNERVSAKGSALNLANLASGKYVSADKHAREIEEAKKTAGGVPDYEQAKTERDAYKSKFEELSAKETHRERVATVMDVAKVGAAVKAEFADFVINEVEKTEDGKKDFDKAVKDYIAKHPQYTATAGRRVVRLDSSKHQDNGNGGGNGGEQKGFFNSFILENR
jgi:hypothetical protein